MSHNITVKNGKTVRLKTAGKYCDRDIVVTAARGQDSEVHVTISKNGIREIEAAYGNPIYKVVATVKVPTVDESFISGTLTEFSDDIISVLRQSAFAEYYGLTKVHLPAVTTVGPKAFFGCADLELVDLPNALTIGAMSFYGTKLSKIDLPAVTSIGMQAFLNCNVLETLILRNQSTVCSLETDDALPFRFLNGQGYIYVPAALVDSYKAATNWSTYASQIRAIEDYPDICG